MKFTPAPDFPLPLHQDGVNRLPPPPPEDRWVTDVLGAPFQARTLRLAPDAEGEVFATLIRAQGSPPKDPGNKPRYRGAVLAIHGWSDYFMQPHLAQFWHDLGYAFYALDLRKCGRSIRHHHTPRYVHDLSEYFADINAAVKMIHQELGPDIPLILWAHSQGGLTASLWADQHRHQVHAMVLNAPWLDWYGGPIVRRATQPLIRMISRAFPRLAVRGLTPTPYDRTLDQRAGGAWEFVASWRPLHSRRVYFSWVEAILAGQSALAKVRDLPFPILVLSATHSTVIAPPSKADQGDAVLDVWSLRQRARRMGEQVSVRSIKGAWHDATLSPQPVRAQVEVAVRDWLTEVGLADHAAYRKAHF